ncbi:MAG: GNAT family N-acetyltransferase [gamma proteobacterium symbiont of Taylorina sp.]|nr:GNAT family N-acetyltransferase [gamma proteobacterium symbiont of Taylorina sp.]
MNIKDLPQPLGFFHIITNTDALHYGYWPENEAAMNIGDAQLAHSQLLLQRFIEPPARILDVGCGLGLMSGKLHQMGYEVTAIAPSKSLIAYAQQQHPGPDFINCGFLEDRPELQDNFFDVILFQESLQYFPDLDAVFYKAGQLLAKNGRLIMCDEVSYDNKTRQRSAVHTIQAIEQSFFAQGFYVQHHEKMGLQVTPTCVEILQGLQQKQQQMIDTFGQQAETQIEQLILEWQNLKDWYQAEIFGYELWELRFSPYEVRAYQVNDEQEILENFNQVFQENRSTEHWRWKYLDNPQGEPHASIAWDNEKLASHYSAYPLPLTIAGQDKQTYHVGDTFTVPAYRGVGRGQTNLLSRVVRHFHKSWCEGQIDFFYGFNTGRIQKLGKRFLSYVAVTPVKEYHLLSENNPANKSTRLMRLLKGYRIELREQSGSWADSLFVRAKQDYAMLITRHAAYLHWRYDQHPDFNYQYVLLKQWNQVVGWCVLRQTEQRLLIVDALCLKAHSSQLISALQEVLYNNATGCTELQGWFADNPGWWRDALLKNNFKQTTQFQNLDLCATFFGSQLNAADLADNFYFTMGDSDLY